MKQNRTNLFLGLLLILVGGWLIVTRQVPALDQWLENNFVWPMWVIGAGLLILLIGLISGQAEMAIPASIVAGVGGILYYQNATGDYGSWAYMWALIPGFVGIGTILAGLLGENFRRNFGHGLRLLVTSAVMFLIFATFFGKTAILGPYGLPILLILIGVYVLARGFIRGGQGANG